MTGFNFDLFPSMPSSLFSAGEIQSLNAFTEKYADRARTLSDTVAKKELERFVIELSWKSSRIEGNTYSLLDTERLLRDGIEAAGHPHEEAIMILDHKKAFDFVLTNAASFRETPSRAAVEETHRLISEGLGVSAAIRTRLVGITGSAYRPLDNEHQIREALDALLTAAGRASDPYSKALIVLSGISYVQPFEDCNKRTGRMTANAVLMANGCAPLSYRSVDEIAYKEATLAFYELNSLVPLKRIFIEQYLFATEQYGLRT